MLFRSISGVVGAGGNLGGMLFGFLFRSESITYAEAFTYIGYTVITIACIVLVTRWGPAEPSGAPQAKSASPATA